jgi:Protein of unknown function (DUF2934)
MKTTKCRKGPHEKPHPGPTEDEIAECAYFIWESEGHPIGREAEHWHEAEMQLYLDRAHDDALESDAVTV